jgi:hypothetical protein
MPKKFTIVVSDDVSRRTSGAENLEELYRQVARDEQAEQAALDWIEANVGEGSGRRAATVTKRASQRALDQIPPN